MMLSTEVAEFRRAAPRPDASAALAEPVMPVRKRFIGLLTLASLGLYTGMFGISNLLLPRQAALISPDSKETAFALISSLGALAAVLANPLIGALSDRTTSRFGRRHGWTIGGATIAAIALILLGHQTTLLGMVVLWCVAMAGMNGMQASLTAEVPDHVPVRQRAVTSAFMGVMPAAGTIVGVVLAAYVFTGLSEGYVALAAMVLLLALPFVLTTRDAVLSRAALAPFRWRDFLAGFWISPRQHPDFAWAWITRFMMQLGSAMFTLYLLFFLRDVVHYEQVFPGKRSEEGVFILTLIYTGCSLLTATTVGYLSDRRGRRKIFVIVSGLVQGAAMLLLAVWHTWLGVQCVTAILALGYGAYIAVDQAMITQVLPAAGNRGKDLGVINFAIAGPYALAPVLAAPLVIQFGGYPTLCAVAGTILVLGSIFVRNIKTVP
ncbi:MFS transporter [Bradyrhizobium prioriisuperbiae]|uniref:MFS transporter n=1 Tax=Bradyrhizobium prioriisuperbiae TaxID=2854389 RepID=UPI0028EE7E0E|nr:MFS transporter [Bradyrhizobium prioritasuperba]